VSYLKKYGLIYIGLLSIVVAVIMLVYTQRYLHIKPCSLCIDQRYAMLLAFIGLLVAFLYKYAGYTITLLAAVYGLYTAINQNDLPLNSNQVCSNTALANGQGTFIWGAHANHLAQQLFTGSGSCAVAGHKLLFTIPLVYWSMLFFGVLTCIALIGWGKEAVKY
jgi:disulfide bond formation protein DsbB